MYLFFFAFTVRRNPFAFNHLPGVWRAMLSGNQSKDVEDLVQQSRPTFPHPCSDKTTQWNQKLLPCSLGHGPHLIPFYLRPSIAHTLAMSVKWGSSRNPTELPLFSCILLPLWEIICNWVYVKHVADLTPQGGHPARLVHNSPWPLPQGVNHGLLCTATVRRQGSTH